MSTQKSYRVFVSAAEPSGDVHCAEMIAALKRMGFRQGLRIRDRFLGIQPKCRPGELYYMPFLLFDQPPLVEALSKFVRRGPPAHRSGARPRRLALCGGRQRGPDLPNHVQEVGRKGERAKGRSMVS